jgi:hypothetical protein
MEDRLSTSGKFIYYLLSCKFQFSMSQASDRIFKYVRNRYDKNHERGVMLIIFDSLPEALTSGHLEPSWVTEDSLIVPQHYRISVAIHEYDPDKEFVALAQVKIDHDNSLWLPRIISVDAHRTLTWDMKTEDGYDCHVNKACKVILPGDTPMGNQKKKCSKCNKEITGKRKKCGKCTLCYYCNTDCQKADWKTHGSVCDIYSQAFKEIRDDIRIFGKKVEIK